MSKPDKPIFNQQGGRGKLYGPTHGATYMGTYQMPDGKMDRARGEFFGHMGYIAKEQTDAVRALARYAGCDLKDIAVQIVCTGDVGFKSVRLALIAAT